MKKGWQCPVCKAVMGPQVKVCVNCQGDDWAIKGTYVPPIKMLYGVPFPQKDWNEYKTTAYATPFPSL